MIAVPSTPPTDSEPPATLTHGNHLRSPPPAVTAATTTTTGCNLGSLIGLEEFAYGLLSKYLRLR